MRQVMEHLIALQRLQLKAKPRSLVEGSENHKLREKVPAPILDHFDRLIARGKKGVALVQNGVCSECHLRISSGTLASLVYTSEVQICGNCGRYLYLPENEPLGLTDSSPRPKPALRKPRRKSVAHVL